MIIKSMRWSTDDGISCGPTSSTFVTELVVTDGNGRDVYVAVSAMDSFERVTVTDKPVLEMWFGEGTELKEHPMRDALEDYEVEVNDDFSEDEFAGSEYLSSIRLARYATDRYRKGCNETAGEFVAGYIGKDADEIEVPVVK